MLPFSSYTRVIPIFLPSSAGVMVRSVVKYTVKYTTRDACPFLPRGAGSWMNPTVREEKCPLWQGHVFAEKGSGLDLHEYAGRDDQAVEGLDGPRGGLEDVDHALVRAHLELLARLLVDVRATEHRVPLDPRRNGNGPADAGVGALGVVDDFLRRRVQRPMVVRLHPNPDPIASHVRPVSNPADFSNTIKLFSRSDGLLSSKQKPPARRD